jgi:hypothetical protein
LAAGESKFVAAETAFHMTDWLGDLKRLSSLFLGKGRWTRNAVTHALGMFLVHVPNHVAAAAKIYSDYPVADIFEVGAIEGSKPRHTALRPLYPLGGGGVGALLYFLEGKSEPTPRLRADPLS